MKQTVGIIATDNTHRPTSKGDTCVNHSLGQPSVSKQNAFVLPVSPPGLSARRHQSYLDTQRSKDLLYENELSARQHLLDIRSLAFGSQVPIIKVKTLAQLNFFRRRDESKNVQCYGAEKVYEGYHSPFRTTQVLLVILPVPAGVAEPLEI